MEHTIEEVKLASGPRGLLINVPGSRVVNFAIGFRAGFSYAPLKLIEIPHLMEHTIFGANAEFKNNIDYSAEFEKNGAYTNAYTNDYLIVYIGECADIEDKRILHLLDTSISTAKFLAKEVKSEMGNVREELTSRYSQHGNLAQDLLLTKMTARRTEQKGLDSLKNINSAKVLAYHKLTHSLGNMFFVMAGNLKRRGELLKQLEQELAGLPKGNLAEIPKDDIKGLTSPEIYKRDIPQIFYQLQQFFEVLPPSDWAALAVIRTVLSGRWKSWIFGEARKRGLAYSISLGFETDPYHSTMYLAAFVTPQNSQQLFELFRNKLLKAKRGEFGKAEIEEAKHFIIGSRLRSYKTPDALVGFYSEDFFVHQYVKNFHEYLDDISKVSMADVKAVATKIFARPQWGLSLVGNIDQKRADQLHGILAQIWK